MARHRDIEDMRLAPITGLFGPNSSGKTGIVQMLLLLKQTAESPDRAQVLNFGDERTLVSLGTFREVLFHNDTENAIGFALTWSRRQARAGYELHPTRTRDSAFRCIRTRGARGRCPRP